MATINPYLNFNGTFEQAFNFYRSVLGGEFTVLQHFRDVPPSADMPPLPASDLDKIMHIAQPIGKDNVLMATDVLESMGHKMVTGNNISISVNAESENEARRVFAALSVGSIVKMPFNKMFWGALFGLLTDPFGIQWMVHFDYRDAT